MTAENSLAGLAGSYVPNVPANWPTPKPKTIQEAIDILASIGGAAAGSFAFTRFVAANGSDTTGDGGFASPFLTIQAALDSITTATAAQPWTVRVSAGQFPDAFVIKPNVAIIGQESTAFGQSSPTLITALADSISLSPAFATAPVLPSTINAAWLSFLQFENHQTLLANPGIFALIVLNQITMDGWTWEGTNDAGTIAIMNGCLSAGGNSVDNVGWLIVAAFHSELLNGVNCEPGGVGLAASAFLLVDSATANITVSDGGFAQFAAVDLANSTCAEEGVTLNGIGALFAMDQSGCPSAPSFGSTSTGMATSAQIQWVTYVPNNVNDWDGVRPFSLANALDRIALGARAYTPNVAQTFFQAGATGLATTPQTVLAIDFTPEGPGTVQVVISLDLELATTDTPTYDLWAVAPLTSVTNGTDVSVGPPKSMPVNVAASTAGITTAPAATTGDHVAHAVGSGGNTADSVTLSAMLSLTSGQRTLIAVVLSLTADATVVAGGTGTVSVVELPLR